MANEKSRIQETRLVRRSLCLVAYGWCPHMVHNGPIIVSRGVRSETLSALNSTVFVPSLGVPLSSLKELRLVR